MQYTADIDAVDGSPCIMAGGKVYASFENERDRDAVLQFLNGRGRGRGYRQPRGGAEEVTTGRLAEAIRCAICGIPYTYTGEDEALPLSFDSDDVTGNNELIAVFHHWHGGAKGERIAVATEGDWRNDDETATSTSIVNVYGALYTVRHNANMAVEFVECLGMLMNDGHNTPNTSATTHTKKEADQ